MEDLIFGYTWEEIQKAQQGGKLRKSLPSSIKENPCTANDIDLLTRYGLKELENRRYWGIIDRLKKQGIIK